MMSFLKVNDGGVGVLSRMALTIELSNPLRLCVIIEYVLVVLCGSVGGEWFGGGSVRVLLL